MAKNIENKIISGRIVKKQDNLLYVIANNGKYNIEYIIDCNCIVKNANRKTYVAHAGVVPLDLQECGTNTFVYHNTDVSAHDMVRFDISAAQYRGNRIYYVPANVGWDKCHAFSKSSIVSLCGKMAESFVPKWYKELQQELSIYGYYPSGPYNMATPVYGASGPALIRANRINQYMEQKNNLIVQKLLHRAK